MKFQISDAKRSAPTRPHPGAPDTPWSEFLVGLFTSPVDKLRDTAREVLECLIAIKCSCFSSFTRIFLIVLVYIDIAAFIFC
jgi:hypothetical protein